MDKTKKRTLEQAKADMDVRVQGLRTVVAHGEFSEKRLPMLRDELQATQRYMRTNCMYEPVRFEEYEKTPEDLEREIEKLQRDVDNANVAKKELGKAASFYRAYHLVAFGPKLRDLKAQLNAAQYWVEQWQDSINNIDCNTEKDIDERFQEKEYLRYEYDRAVDNVQKIQAQIKEIKNTRYM